MLLTQLRVLQGVNHMVDEGIGEIFLNLELKNYLRAVCRVGVTFVSTSAPNF